jgi:hypothetical protein
MFCAAANAILTGEVDPGRKGPDGTVQGRSAISVDAAAAVSCLKSAGLEERAVTEWIAAAPSATAASIVLVIRRCAMEIVTDLAILDPASDIAVLRGGPLPVSSVGLQS